MSTHSSNIDNLFRKRTILIGEISQSNAEHMRILQISGGIDFLLMMEHDPNEATKMKSDTESKITLSQARLDELEADLSTIDDQIKTALDKKA